MSPNVQMRGRFPNSEDQRTIGTLNPESLNLPVFRHSKTQSTAQQVSSLASMAASQKRRNASLKEALRSHTLAANLNSFQRFHKLQSELAQRITKHDSELEDLSESFNTFRTAADPTFVEVTAARQTPYDSVNATLLVSNEQRAFFSNTDLVNMNTELTELIERQRTELAEVAMRLRVFADFDSKAYIPYAIQSLRKGDAPHFLPESAPSKLEEVMTRHKLLKTELAKLVSMRKKMLKPENVEKEKRRKSRLLNAKATLIQKVWRGYATRRRVKKWKEAAVRITSIAKGFLVRLRMRRYGNNAVLISQPPPTTPVAEEANK
jgi:hypothetical protein